MKSISVLSGNTLKILAAFFMVLDHIAVFIFPEAIVLRCFGRLSFPIFAFMISEGARYTKDKRIYLLGISTLALICQLAMYFFSNKTLYMSILVTFSLSLVIIFCLNEFKHAIFSGDKAFVIRATWLLFFALALVYLFTLFFRVDYGLIGILTPVCASIFDFRGISVPEKIKKLDNIYIRILSMGVALVICSIYTTPIQYYSLLALPLLFLYSGKRGKFGMKYFFYVFYPLHILILQFFSLIIKK